MSCVRSCGEPSVLDRIDQRRDITRLEGLVTLSGKISALVHEAQKQRGAFSVFLGSKGVEFGGELAVQRKLLDSGRRQLADALERDDAGSVGGAFGTRIDALRAAVGRTDAHRKVMDGLCPTPPENNAYYAGLVVKALDVVREVSRVASDPTVGARVSAYSAFLALKEFAGQ